MSKADHIVPSGFNHGFGVEVVVRNANFHTIYLQQTVFIPNVFAIQFDVWVLGGDLGEFVSIAIVVAPNGVSF